MTNYLLADLRRQVTAYEDLHRRVADYVQLRARNDPEWDCVPTHALLRFFTSWGEDTLRVTMSSKGKEDILVDVPLEDLITPRADLLVRWQKENET